MREMLVALGLYTGFVVLLFAGSALIPGRKHLGALLPDGTRKSYQLNGFALFLVLLAATAVLAVVRPEVLALPQRYFLQLFVAANIFAIVATVILGLRPDEGGTARAMFFGARLNPTLFGVDLKMFSYRPSLFGLFLLNVSFAAAQYERHGQLTGRMLLYQVFCLIYVANSFHFEYSLLFMWDVIAEKFGGMLIWGDYVLVPFFYGIAGWYLIDDLAPLPRWTAILLSLLFVAGFWMFRGANEQKYRIKMDPAARIWGRPAKLLDGRLLVSGFWGIGRKLNYTGELMIYLSWILLCGFTSAVPYLLPLWLAVLLVHRAWRDDQRCRSKYGELWVDYCRQARFKMLPYVY